MGYVMSERREPERRFYDLVEKFRQKGAVSPDKAMTTEELGLPPRFEEAMKRRLGRSGIFVEANGKYYLSEERLKQLEQMRDVTEVAWNLRKRIITLRLVQLASIGVFVTLFLLNLFFQSWELKIISVVILVVWLLILVLQIYFLSRVRKSLPVY
jgi:hypothetical protein